MTEASKIRLVRCPKCDNLLPELPDFSVYQCGGCGAVLEAKMKGILDDGMPEKREIVTSLGDVSDSFGGRTNETILKERGASNSSSASRTQNREVLPDSDGNRKEEETIGPKFDHGRERSYDNFEYRQTSQSHNRYQDNSWNFDATRRQYVRSDFENDREEMMHPVGSLRVRPDTDLWSMERNRSAAYRGDPRGTAPHRRFINPQYPDEGTSDYNVGSYYRCDDKTYRDVLDGPPRAESLENDRAELLRKINELKDQLSRTCDVAEPQKEKIVGDRRMVPSPPNPHGINDAFILEGSVDYGANEQPVAPDKRFVRPPPFTHNQEHTPYMSRHGRPMEDSHLPTRLAPLGYENTYHQEFVRRPSREPPYQYLQQAYHDRLPHHYMDINQGHFMSHPPETFFHQPACSCLHCIRNWQVPPDIQLHGFSHRRPQNQPINAIHQNVNPVKYSRKYYGLESSKPSHSFDQQPRTRSSKDLDSDGGFGFRHARKMVVTNGSRRVWHAIAGGAPFIVCCSCFELLKLPRKLKTVGKDHSKMRCGSCSSIITCDFTEKGIVVSLLAQEKQVSTEVADAPFKINSESLPSSHGCSDNGAGEPSSNTYENFLFADAKCKLYSGDQKSSSIEPEKGQGDYISSSSFSEDEQSPDSVIIKKGCDSAESPLKDVESLPMPGSPLLERHVNPSSHDLVDKCGKGNKSKRTDNERTTLDRTASLQDSAKDTSMATEMDMSYNEFPNTGVSRDSIEEGREEDQRRINKGGESFFIGLMKKSFGDFPKSNQREENGRANVYVNGQPIPDRIVKKAEKLAGSIKPGEYWYDDRAGFWGVMGHPCLGIIPPKIEEFNCPMPENCAAGNTGVFVNGRELHEKDLELLASRGLPTMRHRSYFIDISGNVIDAHTGEELDGLGKLAPTVEKAKHGFGMKVPRSLVQKSY